MHRIKSTHLNMTGKSGDVTIEKSLSYITGLYWGNGEAIQRSSDCFESHVWKLNFIFRASNHFTEAYSRYQAHYGERMLNLILPVSQLQ